MPLLLRVLDNGLSILWVETIEDVEEVLAVNASAFRHVVGEKASELWVTTHLRPNVLQRKLIVKGHIDPLDLIHSKQVLAFCKDILQEVLVQTDIWWQVELHCTRCKHY